MCAVCVQAIYSSCRPPTGRQWISAGLLRTRPDPVPDRPALLRKAMRCPAVILGLPYFLLPTLPEKREEECILTGGQTPPRLLLLLGPLPPSSSSKKQSRRRWYPARKASTAGVALSSSKSAPIRGRWVFLPAGTSTKFSALGVCACDLILYLSSYFWPGWATAAAGFSLLPPATPFVVIRHSCRWGQVGSACSKDPEQAAADCSCCLFVDPSGRNLMPWCFDSLMCLEEVAVVAVVVVAVVVVR